MKNLTYIFPCLLFSLTSFSQIGINTTEPTTTLDVNGKIRVREMSSGVEGFKAVKVIGVDDSGNFVEIEIGKNIDLIDNRLVATDRIVESGYLPTPFTGTQNNDVDFKVLPGEPNHGKSIIKIQNSSPSGNTEITGILAAPDGTQIWIYPLDGDVKLIPDSPLSAAGNRIGLNSKMDLKRYEMINLFYDAARGKWIVMSHH